MTWPYWLFSNSPLPRMMGYAAQTLGPFIMVPGTTITPSVLVHELAHVDQFYKGWIAGLLLFSVSFALGLSFWWILATPLTFSAAYALASLYSKYVYGNWYRDNIFERQARKAASET